MRNLFGNLSVLVVLLDKWAYNQSIYFSLLKYASLKLTLIDSYYKFGHQPQNHLSISIQNYGTPSSGGCESHMLLLLYTHDAPQTLCQVYTLYSTNTLSRVSCRAAGIGCLHPLKHNRSTNTINNSTMLSSTQAVKLLKIVAL